MLEVYISFHWRFVTWKADCFKAVDQLRQVCTSQRIAAVLVSSGWRNWDLSVFERIPIYRRLHYRSHRASGGFRDRLIVALSAKSRRSHRAACAALSLCFLSRTKRKNLGNLDQVPQND
jgi:hypothetical protein